MEQLEKCPCCHSEKITSSAKIKDYAVSDETFYLSKCEDCSFVFTNPRPDINEIGRYYQSENYTPHHTSNKSLFYRIYRFIRSYMFTKKMGYIRQHLTRKPEDIALLDYGAASGEFLNFCSAQNMHQLVGVEQDATCRQDALAHYGISIESVSEFSTIEPDAFNVITLWHVLEHIHNLDETVNQFYELLKKDGLLVVSVPNYNSLDRTIYGDYWAAYDVPRHLYHFKISTISLLMKRLGFVLEKAYPMPFDAYYIALYSEQYKRTNKLLAIFKAILAGYKSNKAAQKTGEYSSLTYVFRKV